MSKKGSKKEEKPPADAGKDAESTEKGTEIELPYKEGTGKFNVAKAFLAGENDRKRLMKQPGLKNKERGGESRKEKIESRKISSEPSRLVYT
jgi:hypothetical protein